MDYKKAIGFGVVIWILMFVIVSVFIAFKAYDNSVAKIITAVIAGAISYFLAGKIKLADMKSALTYGLILVIAGVILDAIVTTRFSPMIFYSKGLWLGYLLVFLAPILKIKKDSGQPASN